MKYSEKKNEKNRNTAKKTKKQHNRHQLNTDDGGQAMGEESIHHVQMSR